jgi:hypothetical protein
MRVVFYCYRGKKMKWPALRISLLSPLSFPSLFLPFSLPFSPFFPSPFPLGFAACFTFIYFFSSYSNILPEESCVCSIVIHFIISKQLLNAKILFGILLVAILLWQQRILVCVYVHWLFCIVVPILERPDLNEIANIQER